MLIDHLNLNHLRIFECVFRTRSMTAAAQQLHLTQSGVSQHIKSLEDMLEVKLFDRIQQKLVPTHAGQALFERCSQSLQEIENALLKVKGAGDEVSGLVQIGMPIEFGYNVVVPLLAKFCRKHPLVRFKLELGFASQMNEMLLKGDLDFAYVDEFRMDRRIGTERVYDEVLELCISEELLKRKGAAKNTRAYFETLEYVEYQLGEPILRMWFAHHLDTKHIDLNVRATVMDVQAMARFILTEAGAGVLPGHLVAKLIREGNKLHRFKGCGKPLKNRISVASLQDRSHAPAVSSVMQYLAENLTPPNAE